MRFPRNWRASHDTKILIHLVGQKIEALAAQSKTSSDKNIRHFFVLDFCLAK
jgi:hypothetical protein